MLTNTYSASVCLCVCVHKSRKTFHACAALGFNITNVRAFVRAVCARVLGLVCVLEFVRSFSSMLVRNCQKHDTENVCALCAGGSNGTFRYESDVDGASRITMWLAVGTSASV